MTTSWVLVLHLHSVVGGGYSAPAIIEMESEEACARVLEETRSYAAICINKHTGDTLRPEPKGPFTGPNPNVWSGTNTPPGATSEAPNKTVPGRMQ